MPINASMLFRCNSFMSSSSHASKKKKIGHACPRRHFQQAKVLVEHDWAVKLSFILRSCNTVADHLANQALRAGHCMWSYRLYFRKILLDIIDS